jgi:hypothetical protein
MLDKLKRCRSRAVPLVAVTTADEMSTADTIGDALKGAVPDDSRACAVWSLAVGWRPVNDAASAALVHMTEGADPYDPPSVAALRASSRAPRDACLVFIGGHRFCGQAACEEWLKALRDPCKSNGRTIVMLGPSFNFGPDLAPHVEQLADDLPDDVAREAILRRNLADAEAPEPAADVLRLAVAGTRGLPAFGVDQAAALAMERTGIDLPTLRDRWRTQINATQGLTVDDTVRRLDDLGGLESIKGFAARLAGSLRPPSAVVLMDEGGKMLAGGGAAGGPGDTSGVSQGIEAALLTEMQDTGADGMIAFGVPGAGKSASAQAIASTLGVPVIRLDLGALKGSLVGESERNTRAALRTIRALAGRAFWILTCNELGTIKTEIRRRFRSGVWFYDLPSAEERETIRRIYAARYEVPSAAEWPELEGWTGAEIETAAEKARDWRCSPREASAFIVPVSQSSADTIAAMRAAAAGRYLSASYAGPYRGPQTTTTTAAAGRRYGKEA